MRTATGLAFLAAGAILAFAVNADTPGFNLAVAGWILMLTGAAGMFIPARASGWLRRRVILHSPQRLAATQLDRGSDRDRPDPAALAAQILRDAQVGPAGTAPLAARADGSGIIEAELVEEDLGPAGEADGITLRELFDERREGAR